MIFSSLKNKAIWISLVILLLAVGGWFLLPKGPFKDDVLADLKIAGEQRNYEAFAANLKIAYDKNWIVETTEVNEAGQNRNEFVNVESELYIKETERFHQGEVEHTLNVGTIISQAVPQSWRFRYLRTRSMEKLGRDALSTNDLVKAEDYARQILAIMFDLQGANLLGDVYIKKLEQDRDNKDKIQAIKDYNFIIGYQVSDDRKARINELRVEIEKL